MMNPNMRRPVWFSVFAAEYVRITSKEELRTPLTTYAARLAADMADDAQYELEALEREAWKLWSKEYDV